MGPSQGVFLFFLDMSGARLELTVQWYSKASRSLLSLKPKLTTSIADADGSLHSMQPGQHEFPFEFDLPRGLPSTMRCDSGNSCCEIKVRGHIPKKSLGDYTHCNNLTSSL